MLTSNTNFSPIIGEKTMELIKRLENKLDKDEIDTLLTETAEILSHCTNPNINEAQSVTNLAFGYVQSGKTMSFTTLSAMANDNCFRIIVYFAGTKNNLLTQTTKRLRKDLINNGNNKQFYKLHENPSDDDIQLIKNELQLSTKPAILITVLKNNKHIDALTKIFNSSQVKSVLGNNAVLIIDDEADQASLNGYAYENSKKESTSAEWEEDDYTKTYSSILNLKSSIPNHSYIQYTATPQGLLLISILDLLSPKHHTVLTPGKKYTGGKVFFKENPELIIEIPENEVFNSKQNPLQHPPKTLVEALQIHLMNVAFVVRILQKEQYLSMMIHADKEQDASQTFYTWTKEIIEMWTDQINSSDSDLARIELVKSFKNIYPEVVKHYTSPPSFDEILFHLRDIILDTNIELIISRTKKQGDNREINWEGYSSHVLVGAEMLNRGFTVENLAVTYMPRYSVSKSTADTIQQRCRFFGYKLNYLKSCRVYLPEDTILEYEEYVEHEEEMRKWLKEKTSLEEVEQLLLVTPRLNATRKNILSVNTVKAKLNGWRKMNAFQVIEENTSFVERFIAKTTFTNDKAYGTSDRNHRYARLPIQEVIEFLSNFKFSNMPDATRKQATIRYMKYLATKEKIPLKYAYIIQMAYDGEARERAFDEQTMKLKNLHSGHSPSGQEIYPGDAKIRFEDSICIQIHKVKLKCNSNYWNGKVAYTLAIYYPEDFAINYETTQGQNEG